MEEYSHKFLQSISLGSIDLQKFITQTYLEPCSNKVLSDYISADFQQNNKKLALTAVNLLNKLRLNNNVQNLQIFWNQFKDNFLLNNTIEWRYIHILIKTLQAYREQMGQQFNWYFVQIFSALSFKWKIVLYKSIIQKEQISFQNIFVFIRQTIQNFMVNGLKVIYQNHQNSTSIRQEDLIVENQFLKALSEALYFIQIQQDQLFVQLRQKTFERQDVFDTVKQQLVYSSIQNYRGVQLDTFDIKNVSFRYFGDDKFDLLNQNKALALQIFATILKQFNKFSLQEDFDKSKTLLALQEITPLIIKQLIVICLNKSSHEIKKFKQGIISMLCFLSVASKFNFLLSIFRQFSKHILFIIFPTFLKADPSQIENYYQDPKEFINLNCIVLEDDLQKTKINTIKQACILFFQKYLAAVNQSILTLVNVTIDTIDFLINQGEKKQQLEQIFKLGYEPTLQVCILILTKIFFQNQKSQNQINYLILNNFINREYFIRLQKIDRARFISFLLYTYNYFYEQKPSEGLKLIQYVYNAMIGTKDKVIFLYSLEFFEDRIKQMTAQVVYFIWKSIVHEIKTTERHQIIKLVTKIVKLRLNSMNFETVKELLQIVFERINSQYNIQIGEKGSHMLISCLNIIQEISENRKYISQQYQIVNCIWPLFQFFENTKKIEYEDNIIQIFNNLLSAQQKMTVRYYQYVQNFQNITKKYRYFTNLAETYFLLIIKGQPLFLSTLNQNMDLCNLIKSNLQLNVFQNREAIFVPSYVLLQFLLISYPQLVQQNQQFYEKTLDLYKKRSTFKQKQNISAVLVNYLIAYLIVFDKGNISFIEENSIQIYKGYHGRLFAVNISKLIQKYAFSQQIIQILQYSIRILHFLKGNPIVKPQKVKKSFFEKVCEKYIISDPFSIIQQSFIKLRNTISRQKFQQLMRILQQRQLPQNQIKQLFMYKQIHKKTRQIAQINRNYNK